MNKMKVALICPADFPVPSIKGGAVETLMQNIIEENEIYKELDIYVYSHYYEEAKKESLKYGNSNFIFIKMDSIWIKGQTFINKVLRKFFKKKYHDMFIEQVAKDLRVRRVDAIVVEANKFYVETIAEKVKDSKIYLHIHHDTFNDQLKENRDIVKACTKIITVSDYITKQTSKHKYADTRKIETLLNGIDVNIFNKKKYLNERSALRNKYGISENEKVILFSGRILEIKGIRELILAFRKYCINQNVKLLIVGNAGFASEVFSDYDRELKIISEEVEDKIIFTGFIHNSKLPQIHAIADVAVVPSLWDEPAGLVVIEALASGLPIIVTDSGGIPEYINNDCAIVIKRDMDLVDNLGKALLELIQNDNLRFDMGDKARDFAKQFNTTKYYKEFVKILNIE